MKEEVVTNGESSFKIEDIIILGLRIPGIKVNRDEFLRKEFERTHAFHVVLLFLR